MPAILECTECTQQQQFRFETLQPYKPDGSVDKIRKKIDKQKIVSQIISVRESFLHDKKKEITAYDLRHDQAAYLELAKFRFPLPEAYEEVKKTINDYTKAQLETHLGERMHVLLRTTRYRIKDGHFYPEDGGEPFIATIRRGRDFCRIHSNPIDHAREDAEVSNFEEIEADLCHPDAKAGAIRLSLSPYGERRTVVINGRLEEMHTRYTHNFYDVFVLKERINEDGQTERYVETYRYSSGLSKQQTAYKASALDSRFFRLHDVEDSASYLRMPITIDPDTTRVGETQLRTPDDIHRYFHTGHDYMSKEDFQIILRECQPFIHRYLEVLSNDPANTELQTRTFKAVLNKAEEVKEYLDYGKARGVKLVYAHSPHIASWDDIDRLGNKDVPFRPTGCGPSGSKSTNGSFSPFMSASVGENLTAPFSVGVFGKVAEDDMGPLTFQCTCGAWHTREPGKLIPVCTRCGARMCT